MQNASTSRSKSERRAQLTGLLASGRGSSQRALVDALAALGVEVTQATLSRDLRELGAVKGPGGYRLPGATTDPLQRALGEWLVSATAAQNLVVLKTPPGGAAPLAVVLDAARRPEIVGTVAGDDTIMAILPTSKAARALAEEFELRARESA